MRSAVLTIDDSPNLNTLNLVTYLSQRKVPAVFFCIGKNIEENYDQAKHIIRAGFEIGNHSYSHQCFSDISLDESISEIENNEAIIDDLYDSMGVERKSKYFRFPFGNKGSANKIGLQEYLKKSRFERFASARIEYPWYIENGLDEDLDIFWTFDCEDYRFSIPPHIFGMNDVFNHMDEKYPKNGGSLMTGIGAEIILMHDNEYSHKRFPKYYEEIISKIEEKGISIVGP